MRASTPSTRKSGFCGVGVSMLARHPISDAFCGLKVLPREVLARGRRASRCRWGDLDLIFAAPSIERVSSFAKSP